MLDHPGGSLETQHRADCPLLATEDSTRAAHFVATEDATRAAHFVAGGHARRTTVALGLPEAPS